MQSTVTEEKRYLTLKRKLDNLHYPYPLNPDSTTLVEKLLNDLISTSEGFQKLQQKTKSQEKLENSYDSQISKISLLEVENKKLIQENNNLHLEIINSKENSEQIDINWKNKYRSILQEQKDLKFTLKQKDQVIEKLNNQIQRMQQKYELNEHNLYLTQQGLENLPPELLRNPEPINFLPNKNRENILNIGQASVNQNGEGFQELKQSMFNKNQQPQNINRGDWQLALETAQQEIENLTKNNRILQDDENVLSQKIGYLAVQVQNRDREIARLSQRLDLGSTNLDKLQKDTELENLKEKVGRLNHQIDLVNGQNSELKKDLALYKGKGVERTALDNQKLKSENQKLKTTLADKNKKELRGQSTVDYLKNKNSEKINQKLSEIEILKADLDLLNDFIKQLEQENQDLKDQNQTVQQQLQEDLDLVLKEKRDIERQLEDQKQENEAKLLKQAELNELNLDRLQQENEKIADKMKVYQQIDDQAISENQRKLEIQQQDIEKCYKQIDQYQDIMQDNKDLIRKLQSENSDLGRQLKQSQIDYDILQKQIENEQYKDDKDNLEKENLMLRLQGEKEERFNLQKLVDSQYEKEKTLKEAKEILEAQLEDLKYVNKAQQAQIDSKIDTSDPEQIRKLESMISESERENQALKLQVTQGQRREQSLQEQLKELSEKSENIQLSLKKLQEYSPSKQQLQESQKKQNSDLQSTFNNNNNTQNLAVLQDKLKEEMKENNRLQKQLQKSELEVQNLQKSYKDANLEIKSLARQKQTLNDFSQTLQDSLKNKQQSDLQQIDLLNQNNILNKKIDNLEKYADIIPELEDQIKIQITELKKYRKMEDNQRENQIERELLERQIIVLKKQQNQDEQTIQNLQEQNNNLASRNQDGSEQEILIVQLQKERIQYLAEVQKMQRLVEEQNGEIERYLEKIENLQAQLVIEKEKRHIDFESKMDDIQNENQDLRSYINRQQSDGLVISDLQKTIENLRNKLDIRQNDLQDLIQAEQNLKEENSKLRLSMYNNNQSLNNNNNFQRPDFGLNNNNNYDENQDNSNNFNRYSDEDSNEDLERIQRESGQLRKTMQESAQKYQSLSEKINQLEREMDSNIPTRF